MRTTPCLTVSFDPDSNTPHTATSSAELPNLPHARSFAVLQASALLTLLLFAALAMFGCGGGYPGLGIASLTSSAATIDAGQTVAISATLNGTVPTAWTIVSSNCSPAGCGTLSATSGNATTYTAPAPLAGPIQVVVQDAVSGTSNAKTVTITVNPDPAISGTPPSGTVGTAYSTKLTAAGGTGALTLSLAGGSLPAGLTFNAATGIISGTPTAPGTYNFVAQVVDSSATPFNASASETIVITAPGAALTFLGGNPPSGTVGTAYATVLTASGGTQPYTFSVLSGTLPSGLALAPTTGLISGTPTAQGTYTFTAQVADAAGSKATAIFSITVAAAGSNPTPIAITVGTLPGGTVNIPYTATIGVTGGTAPYACAIVSGTLQAGLTLGANCVVSGTPTVAGTASLVVKAMDSTNPAQTTTGPVSLTIAPAATVTLTLTTGTLPNGTVGTAYSSTIGVTGGTGPYSCAITSGTLPAGLALGSNCLVSGTPTAAGTASLVVKATDSASPQNTGSGPVGVTIGAAPVTLTLTTGTLPNGTVGTAYSSTIGVTGGTGPYSCAIVSGLLPAGLTLGANCLVSGTPTAAGTASLVVKATDSASPQNTGSGPVGVTIAAAAATLVLNAPPSGTVGTLYDGSIPVTGGTGPYTCVLVSGTLQAGLSLGANCHVTGTPTASGASVINVKATDSASPTNTNTGAVTVTINPAAVTLVPGNPPPAVIGTVYTGTIPVTGGTGPYACTLNSGTVPAGLTLNANCTLTGTPTGAAGSTTISVTTTDSFNPKNTGTGPVTVTTNPAPLAIAPGSLPSGTVGAVYSSPIGVAGGTAPYTCTITSGALPAGLTLGAACLVSGTPTAAGTVTLGVKATDSANPQASGSGTVNLTINPSPLAVGNPPAATVGSPYTGTIPVTGGTGPYTCTLAGGALPAGLTLNANCTVTGTPTGPAGSSPITITVGDGSNPKNTITAPVTITTNPAPLTIAPGSLPAGTVGTVYSSPIGVTGGTAPYTCTITSGALPAGLTLGAGCLVGGTPTAAGTVTLGVKATDAANPQAAGTGSVNLTINPAPVTLTLGNPPAGTAGSPYTGTVPVTGGTGPYTCAVVGGTLQTGLTLNANCTITGTTTVTGTSTVMVKATDGSSPANTGTGSVAVTINPAPVTLTLGNPPAGTAGSPYTGTVPVTGGTGPYTCAVVGGTLQTGLTLNANCTITGTTTVTGTSTVMVKATDGSSPANTGTGSVAVTINPAPVTLTLGNPPAGTAGSPYTGTVPVTGGTGPYTCAVVGGTLQTGLTLNANCTITGTTTVTGTSTVMVKATDGSSPANTGTGSVAVTINPAPVTLTLGNPPAGTAGSPYTGTVPVTGGTGPYTCAVVGGTLQTGLTLNANCTITGTTTVTGTSTVMVKATDGSSPANTGTGSVAVTINPAPVTLTLGNPPAGTAGSPYTGTVPVTGGTGPYTCAVVGGTLQTGLTLNANCTITGTTTVTGTSTVMVKATDGSSPANTGTGSVAVTINPAPVTLTLGNPPAGTAGSPYTGTVPVTGGTGPYTCAVVGGTLQTGLTLNANCTITGTTMVTGTSTVMVKATDGSSPANTGTGSVAVTINPAPVTLTLGNPPAGTAGSPYTGTVPVTGGTGPYTCAVVGGTLQTGLTLNANCTITGTTTVTGTSTVMVKATDGSSPANTGTGSVAVTINPGPVLTLGNPPAATIGTPYTGTVPVTGGLAPYKCSLAGGTLPAGLILNANCTVTGTPTGTAGSTSILVMATDSSNPAVSTTAPVVITTIPPPALAFTGTLPNATVNVPYSQTLQATGGVGPYTYAITSGALPAGLTLSTAGVVSGTPTTPGATAFTVTATDSEATPQTAPLPLTLLVVYATNAQSALLNGPYAFLFQGYDDVVAGVLSYQTATIGSFTADGTGAVTAGEQDSNHQASNPTAITVPTTKLLGTYTLGADLRGTLTLTTFNADGSTGRTTTYAISVKPAVAPATSTARGSLIEFDNDKLVGTRGSGTFLAQTASAFAAGLTGNYAFGLQGDTPCLPACTVGVVAGPAAAVGQFTTAAGAISNGTGDANVASTNFANSALSGTYAAADSNGRVQMSLTTSNVPLGVYPSDFAVYMVSANQAFVMSTDKHSAYILLAGSATSQSTTAFAPASLTGPYVGYENSPTNPGLVGSTLQNVLNLSTATIFRGTANGAGTCNTTNVDQGGVTGLANGLTGLGSGAPIVNALLGTYASTGNSSCTVAASGRAVLNYPVPNTALTGTLVLLGLPVTAPAPRVAYFTSTNNGYFLETGYAGLGYLEAQTGAPFTTATLKGTYVYGTTPAASLASTNASGVFTADGAGHATTTLDENVGVGTVNALQLGVGGTFPYVLTDATAGRFVLGTSTVIYAISPSRFVLLDTNATTTSPSVALIY